jgi:hypothetical protein
MQFSPEENRSPVQVERAKEYRREWYKKNREKNNAYKREWAKNHREEQKAWRDNHKETAAIYHKAYRLANRERLLLNGRKHWRVYYRTNREALLNWRKAYYQEHPDKMQSHHRKSRYGLSREDVDCLIKIQGNVCAICGKPGWSGKEPHIDHNHETGRVRGLLCFHCNLALGLIKDNPRIAQAMIDYLNVDSSEGGVNGL